MTLHFILKQLPTSYFSTTHDFLQQRQFYVVDVPSIGQAVQPTCEKPTMRLRLQYKYRSPLSEHLSDIIISWPQLPFDLFMELT